MSNDGKWNSLFDEPNGQRGWKWIIGFSVLFIIIIIVLKLKVPFFSKNDVAVIIIDTLVTMTTGIIGASLLNIFYKAYESKKLNQIKSIKYDDMLVDLFKVLEHAEGKYRKDEHITLTFDTFHKEGKTVKELLQVEIKYEFKTVLKQDSFSCYYYRSLRKANPDNPEGENIGNFTTGMEDRLMKCEFYWMNDECDCFPLDTVTDSDYSIYDAYIDDYDFNQQSITPVIKEKQEGKEIVYTLKYPDDKKKLNLSVEHTIGFTASFPMESESILFLTHEFPTENTRVEIDYTKFVNDLYLYIIPVTGAIHVQGSPGKSEGKEYYTYKGWMLPKSGYIVAWWDKLQDEMESVVHDQGAEDNLA